MGTTPMAGVSIEQKGAWRFDHFPKLKTVLLNVNFVIEGYIDPTEPLREEGPFGDHTGYYTLPEPYPVFHVTAITYRKDAVSRRGEIESLATSRTQCKPGIARRRVTCAPGGSRIFSPDFFAMSNTRGMSGCGCGLIAPGSRLLDAKF